MGWHPYDRGPGISWAKNSPKNRSYATKRQRTVWRRRNRACVHSLSHQIGGGQCGLCGKFNRREHYT